VKHAGSNTFAARDVVDLDRAPPTKTELRAAEEELGRSPPDSEVCETSSACLEDDDSPVPGVDHDPSAVNCRDFHGVTSGADQPSRRSVVSGDPPELKAKHASASQFLPDSLVATWRCDPTRLAASPGNEKAPRLWGLPVVGREGFEPSTLGLRVRLNELQRNVSS
jgi:hypothetical protein